MGHKGVNSKLLKQYGDMTDGGRTYDRAGSTKNKMGLKHLLKITKHIIQEHKLHNEAAYTLFRKALTGKALESSILMEDNGTSFPHFFTSLQMLNNVQDNKSELQAELTKLKGSKPRDMPHTMMRIHHIHNKIIQEGDSEKERMNIVIQLTRNDVFDILRDYYPFIYTQIIETEHKLKMAHLKEMKNRKAGNVAHDNGTEYHPFQTLFQIACKFIRIHEPLQVRHASVHAIKPDPQLAESSTMQAMHAIAAQATHSKTEQACAQEVAQLNAQMAGVGLQEGKNVTNTTSARNDGKLLCFQCNSPDHFKRDCPQAPPICNHCGKRGHNVKNCWALQKQGQMQPRYSNNGNNGGARNNIQQNTNGQAGFKQNYNGYNQNRWNSNGPYRPQQRDPAASGGQLEGRNSRPQGQYRQQGQFRGNNYQNNGATQQYSNQRNYNNVNAMESFEQEN